MQSSCVCTSSLRLRGIGLGSVSMDILGRGGSHSEWDQNLAWSHSTKSIIAASTLCTGPTGGTTLLEHRIQATTACHLHTKPEEGRLGMSIGTSRGTQTQISPKQGTGHIHISCGHIGTHTQALTRTCSHMSTQGRLETCAGKGREQGITHTEVPSPPKLPQGAAPASLFTVFLTITPTTWCRPEPGTGRRPKCIFWEHPLWDPPPSKVTLT